MEDVPDRQMTELIAALAKASIRMQPQLDEGKREDWINVVQDDLAPFPFALVLEGIDRAKAICKYPSEFVPTVLEFVEPRQRKLLERIASYEAVEAATR